jgi:RNA polymerase sigma factor (sigma-70 family)
MRQRVKMDYKGDQYYIQQILQGNLNAYSYIVDKHKDHAYNLAYRICGNREDAEEVVQDSFLKAYSSLAGFKMRSAFSTWLFRIVYNTSISLLRQKKKTPVSIDDFPAEYSDFRWISTSEEETEVEYRKTLINFALQKLSSEERGLIGLYYFEELNLDEISAVTGVTKSNIKVRLFRARQKMLETIQNAEKKSILYHEKIS